MTLQAVGLGGDSPAQYVFGPPIELDIQPPRPMPARGRSSRFTQAEPFQVHLASGKSVPIEQATNKDWLAKAGVELNQPFEISGQLNAPEEGVYQVELEFLGNCEVRMDGLRIFNNSSDVNQHYYIPVALEQGIHRLDIRGSLRDTLKFFLAFGHRGSWSVVSDKFRP